MAVDDGEKASLSTIEQADDEEAREALWGAMKQFHPRTARAALALLSGSKEHDHGG